MVLVQIAHSSVCLGGAMRVTVHDQDRESRVDTERVRASVPGMNTYRICFWQDEGFIVKGVDANTAREAVTTIKRLYETRSNLVTVDSVCLVTFVPEEIWA